MIDQRSFKPTGRLLHIDAIFGTFGPLTYGTSQKTNAVRKLHVLGVIDPTRKTCDEPEPARGGEIQRHAG